MRVCELITLVYSKLPGTQGPPGQGTRGCPTLKKCQMGRGEAAPIVPPSASDVDTVTPVFLTVDFAVYSNEIIIACISI